MRRRKVSRFAPYALRLMLYALRFTLYALRSRGWPKRSRGQNLGAACPAKGIRMRENFTLEEMSLCRPLAFKPDLRDYPWGKRVRDSNILRWLGVVEESEGEVVVDGRALEELGLTLSSPVAECWMASDDAVYPSVVVLDAKTERPFNDLLQMYPEELLGAAHVQRYGSSLGVMGKLLDTHADRTIGVLSAQVHPPEAYPDRPPKPEAWVALESSGAYLGFSREVDPDELIPALERGDYDLLHKVDMRPGDVVMVRGGMFHALLNNSFVFEVSVAPIVGQMQDIRRASVRAYDGWYGRRSRETEPEEAIDIIREADGFKKIEAQEVLYTPDILWEDAEGNRVEQLVRTTGFVLERMIVETELRISFMGGGYPVFAVEGTVAVRLPNGTEMDEILRGEYRFIPACLASLEGDLVFVSLEGPARVLRWRVPLNKEKA